MAFSYVAGPNFQHKVRAVSEWNAEGEWAVDSIPQTLTEPIAAEESESCVMTVVNTSQTWVGHRGISCWLSESVEQNVRASLHPSIFFNADGVPTYLYGIVAGIVVLVVVFVAIVGVIAYYYYRKNKVVIMKVNTKGGFCYWMTMHVCTCVCY